MTLRERFIVLAGLVIVIAAGAGGSLLGMRLGEAASAPGERRLAISDPDATLADSAAARSAGGFTGFGGRPALRGDVLRSGEIKSAGTGSIEVASPESASTVRYSTTERLFRIDATSLPLRAGDLVQVHVKDGAVTAVLRLPAGLDEGINRGP